MSAAKRDFFNTHYRDIPNYPNEKYHVPNNHNEAEEYVDLNEYREVYDRGGLDEGTN